MLCPADLQVHKPFVFFYGQNLDPNFFFDHQLSPEKTPNALFGVPLEFEDLTGPPATLLPPRRSFAAPAPPLGPSLLACQPRGGRGAGAA